eukprot:CAMPEP_0176083916 /NCGR_PEP_ID=MMETSP0120_2-20121206/41990_1 /TAXON_ID=160619 /ORGANISM="Kryptoperidinium foliaceum, Strain CCMP 1326" /LENGTH=52 /DNA_ID=CAMNT_0017417713 /DNA_START=101 /DNA_END=256 /DNA_ORIENTATION=+
MKAQQKKMPQNSPQQQPQQLRPWEALAAVGAASLCLPFASATGGELSSSLLL